MDMAIIALTKNGAFTGQRIKEALENEGNIELFTLEKFISGGTKKIQGSLRDFTGILFQEKDAIIFITAAGIAVRSIAPYLKDKKTDPGVVVVDEQGKNIISLLSGHLGGANELAREIAEKIQGNAIITTASDVQGKPCVEDLARGHGFSIEGEMTKVNAAIVNGEKLGLINESGVSMELYNDFIVNPMNLDDFSAVIYITDGIIEKPANPSVILRPRNLIVGIGCKKGVSKEELIAAINDSFKIAGKSPESLKALSTIDRKANENGIRGAAEEFGVPLIIIDSKEIKKKENDYNASKFVKEKIGVGAVSEPCAVLGGKDARLILEKTKFKGITIAMAREEF